MKPWGPITKDELVGLPQELIAELSITKRQRKLPIRRRQIIHAVSSWKDSIDWTKAKIATAPTKKEPE